MSILNSGENAGRHFVRKCFKISLQVLLLMLLLVVPHYFACHIISFSPYNIFSFFLNLMLYLLFCCISRRWQICIYGFVDKCSCGISSVCWKVKPCAFWKGGEIVQATSIEHMSRRWIRVERRALSLACVILETAIYTTTYIFIKCIFGL